MPTTPEPAGGTALPTMPRAAGRTLAEFEPLLPREDELLTAVRDGRPLGLGARPAPGTADRRVRGRFLRFLALGGDEQAVIHENGIDLSGAWIEGPVALDNVAGKVFLAFRACAIDALTATDAALPLLALNDSRIAATLNAARLACPAGLYCDGLEVAGLFTLDDARLGALQLDGARLAFGLRAQRLVCTGGIYLRAGFRTLGPLDLTLVEAGNDVDCTGGIFVNPLFATLDADGKAVARPRPVDGAGDAAGDVVQAGQEAAARAAVVARLAAQLAAVPAFDGVAGPAEDKTAAAIAAIVYAPPLGADGTGAAAAAIELSGATIKGNLFLNGATVFGRVSATVAHIGLVTADDARLAGDDTAALDLRGATVERMLRLYDVAEAAGPILLRGATAGVLQVEATARWAGNARFTLDGFRYDRLDIQGDAPRYSDWAAAWIGCASDDGRREFRAQPWDQLIARLRANLATWIGGAAADVLREFQPHTGVQSIPTLHANWPTWIGGAAADGKHEFRPQPWDQLIATLRASGHPLDATRLAIMKEDEYRRAGKIEGVGRLFHWLHGVGVAYGYRPLRLVGWLAGLWLLAALSFEIVKPYDLLRHVEHVDPNCLATRFIDRDPRPCLPPVKKSSDLSSLRYSADLLIPGLHLGEADEWKVNLPPDWPQCHAGWGQCIRELIRPPVWLGLFVWLERIVGAGGVSVLAVVVGGYLLKKRD